MSIPESFSPQTKQIVNLNFTSFKDCGTKDFGLFIYLFNNLFKVDKFTKIQYIYVHRNSHANWSIKVNYPVLQKIRKTNIIKTKEKKKVKQVCDIS